MKVFRLWLLLVLAVLLPIRGAVAAAMLCPVGGTGPRTDLRIAAPPASPQAMDHGMAHDHAGHHAGHHADHQGEHPAAGPHHEGQDRAAPDRCNLCSAFCSLTPLPSDAPALPEPPGLAGVKFPDLSTPATSFISDGQERPPRTT